MTATEALKACVDALGITDELDVVIKKNYAGHPDTGPGAD